MNGQQHGLFKGKQPKPPAPQEPVELILRLRTLEERYSGLERRLQVNEQNMLSGHRKINSEVKTLSSDIRDLKSSLEEVKERIKMLVTELRESARQEDVDVLKKYLNFWEPMKFVTQDEIDGIVKRVLDKQLSEGK